LSYRVPKAAPRSANPRTFAPASLVFCATLLAYLPALAGGFIWNDSDYVTAPALRTVGGLFRIWTEVGATQQYYPLLHSAFWAQYQLWGGHALGYHLVTVLFHALSAVLFALVLRRLLQGPTGASHPLAGAEWLAALIFALHPVHVESVAWISEQKNTLSTALYLASALAYLGFDEDRRAGSYALALALFISSLLCKTVTATLPAALLVVFWWRRGRIEWRRDVLPLVPWIALGAAVGLFSSWVERRYVGAQGADFDISAAARVLVAGRAVWVYAAHLAWPFGLNFLYPRWAVDTSAIWQWLFPLGVAAAGGALWAVRGRSRGPLAAFLLFVGSLFPALGFVNLYGARYSWVWDHWQYMPDLGPIALAAVGLAAAWRAAPLARGLGAVPVAALALFLGFLTWEHCRMFHDDETLYRVTLSRNPTSWLAHNNLGTFLAARPGREAEAASHLAEAVRIEPSLATSHYNLASVLARMPGRSAEAIAEFGEALRLMPDYGDAHSNLGIVLARTPGRLDDAVAQYEEALRFEPGSAQTHNNLANALARMPGRMNDAVVQYEEAIAIDPGFAVAHSNLGLALLMIPGRLDEAVRHLEEAVRLDPGHPEAHFNLANALMRVPGRSADAVAQYEEAIRLNPGYAEARGNLGTVLAHMPGRLDDAVAQYEEALRLRPDSAVVHLDLAIALLRIPGRAGDAQAHLEAALRINPAMDSARSLLAQLRASRP
jgi:tetratricopeptide (TPR) repeat protein